MIWHDCSIVELLLKYGAHPNIKDAQGRCLWEDPTLLEYCCFETTELIRNKAEELKQNKSNTAS